jgi:hypothetical protein
LSRISSKSFFFPAACLFNADADAIGQRFGSSDVVEYSVGQSDSWLLGRRDQSLLLLKNGIYALFV